jgi:hypothetical protein
MKTNIAEGFIRGMVLQNRRRIQNAWKPITTKVTRYNNKLVDEVVINKHEINIPAVKTSITALFEPAVLKSYQSILKSPLVPSTLTNRIWIEGTSKDIADMIGTEYGERIGKNIEAIQKILQDTDVNIGKYEQMAKNFPGVDRVKIVQKAMDNGQNWSGHTYSYKELDNMNKGITKYIDSRALQDKYELNTDDALSKGVDPAKQNKVWVWSQLENTRHEDMDGQTVDIKDTFTVTNSQTGAVDELLFPGDINNDSNNCSNICNCQCEVMYV